LKPSQAVASAKLYDVEDGNALEIVEILTEGVTTNQLAIRNGPCHQLVRVGEVELSSGAWEDLSAMYNTSK